MTDPNSVRPESKPAQADQPHSSRHGWTMIAFCLPVLVVAVILVATKVVGVGFLLVAVACPLMMAMMRGMGHGSGHR
ncbi:MAG TPA: hypothetical protein VF086_10645 [Propionibacteriaceae bacterium]